MFKIYKDKKVFITGNTGFKGSWLSKWLLMLGADVVGFSHEKYPHFDQLGLDAEHKTHLWNIRNTLKVREILLEEKPDIIFHLAAQPIVSESYRFPLDTYSTNILGTVNLCEAVRELQPKAFICITTDKVYADQPDTPAYRETDILGGYDPYACSKVCMEYIVDSYKKSFLENTFVATARAGNVVGGGDWSQDRLIPDLMRAVKANSNFILRNPHHVRPWQHVVDVLAGYLLLGEKLLQRKQEYQGAWNFGPDVDSMITTQQLINKCKSYYPEINNIIGSGPKEQFHETKHLILDSTKARLKLGWKPKWNIDKTLEKTMDWYEEFITCGKLITEEQIINYMRENNEC